MFKRRTPHPVSRRMLNLLWPRIGWMRTLRYALYRLARLPHKMESTAAALAAGAAITFIPLPGLHLLLIIAMCWLTRLPILPGCIGTLVGNPWTLPPAFLASYEVGKWVAQTVMTVPERDVPLDLTFANFMVLLKADPVYLIVPWLGGGILLSLLSFPVFYILFAMAVRQGHDAKAAFVQARRDRRGQA
ncbi:MAG: DUF2062 domain-containing protein [Pseudomonadota bacterium]